MNFCDIHGQYKKVNGFDDYYITEFGEVFSTRPIGASKEHKLHKINPKRPDRRDKYYNVILCRDDGQHTKAVHRLVAEHFVDGYFDGAVPNHIDGDAWNNDSSNLEWVSVRDNIHKSYITSGIPSTRNIKRWSLYSPSGELVGSFYNRLNLRKYISDNDIDASALSLEKYGISRGYRVVRERVSAIETVTTIRKEYDDGGTPSSEVPVPVNSGEDIV